MANLKQLFLNHVNQMMSQGAEQGSKEEQAREAQQATLAQMLQGKQADQANEMAKLKQGTVEKNAQLDNSLKTAAGLAGVDTSDPDWRANTASGLREGGSGIALGPDSVSVTKGFNPNQVNQSKSRDFGRINAAKNQTLGKMEEGIGMAKNAEAFLQNPNGYNTQELKVLIPMMQGWPARAMGTEVKASGFSPGGWNTALADLQKYADDPKGNPLTPQTLDVLRSNFKTVKDNLIQRHDAAAQQFWGTTAPGLGSSLAPEEIQNLQKGNEQFLQGAYGDYHHVPWEAGTDSAKATPSAVVPATPAPASMSILDRLSAAKRGLLGRNPQAAPTKAPSIDQPPKPAPVQGLRVKNKATGAIGTLTDPSEFDPTQYDKVQ